MLLALIKRNVKLFFKDKGMFFTSLITPVILLVLYISFLGNIYRDSFMAVIPSHLSVSEKVLNGLVAGQLISSIFAVSCVTVAFCSNFLMVQDRTNGSAKDLRISPVKASALSLSYYLSSLISTAIICYVAMGICLIYVATVGWFFTAADLLLLALDVLLVVLFGTALSSIVNFFLTSQGQISAVGTVVSSGYGFICGAYMPISSFGEGLQRVISFLPGTYGTSLIRNHSMRGAFAALEEEGIPAEMIAGIKDGIDCNLYFFEKQVDIPVMYAILAITVVILIGVYILMNAMRKKSI